MIAFLAVCLSFGWIGYVTLDKIPYFCNQEQIKSKKHEKNIAHKEQLLEKFLNFAVLGEKSRHHAFRKRFAIPLTVNLDNSRELWSIKGVLPMWYSYILSILGITISIGVSDFLIQFTGSPEPTARISKVGSHFLFALVNLPLINHSLQGAK